MTDSDHLGLGLAYDDEEHRRSRPRRPRRRAGRLVVFVIALAVVVGVPAAVLVGGRGLLDRFHSAPADYTGSGTGSVTVHVKPGDSLTAVGQTLQAAGVVESVGAFTKAVSDEPKATGLQPGYYRLRKHMSAASALALLLAPSSRISTNVTIPEGSTAEQVIHTFADKTDLGLSALKAAAKHPSSVPLPAYAHGNPEGFLFPATYQIDPGTTADDAVGQMVEQYEKHAQQLGLEAGARRLHLSPYQVLIVASIVQAEARHSGDFPKVAQVVYNRLHKGMALQVDSTLNYVRKQRTLNLTYADLAQESAYNTYLHVGLPPTPIDNPGAQALAAALHPTGGDILYFVTVDKQGHNKFTASYSQFLQFKQEAKANGVVK